MRIVVLGLPGAGKGTQAALLAQGTGVPHVATGNIFRQAMADGTPLGLRVREIVEGGGLVPDELTVAIVRERLQEPDAAGGFVLDGFPRTVAQAAALDALLDGPGRAIERALHLDVPQPRVLERLVGRRICSGCGATYHVQSDPPNPDGTCRRCGRPVVQRTDDREEVQRRRLDAYRRETEPLLPYYAAQGKLVRVDGDAPPADVAVRVREAAGQ